MSTWGRFESWVAACILSLLPLVLWLLVHWTLGDHAGARQEAARELLFFALSMFSLSLNTLRRSRSTSGLLFQVCLTCAIGTAALYGVFLTGEYLRHASMMHRAYSESIVSACVALGFAAIVHAFTPTENNDGA
jgi:hypothetical protein